MTRSLNRLGAVLLGVAPAAAGPILLDQANTALNGAGHGALAQTVTVGRTGDLVAIELDPLTLGVRRYVDTALTVVPEPATLSLMGLGLAAVAAAARRRKRTQSGSTD